jgi:hypothetical protein
MKQKAEIVETPLGRVRLTVDKRLDKYSGKVLFPEQLAKAKETFSRISPEELKKLKRN